MENFFGFSESIIDCFRNVNQLVAFRIQLSREDTFDLKKEKFQSILKDLVQKIEQGNMWGTFYWAKGMESRPRRVQRGTMVSMKGKVYSPLSSSDELVFLLFIKGCLSSNHYDYLFGTSSGRFAKK